MCVRCIFNNEFKFLSIYIYICFCFISERFDPASLIYGFTDESIGYNYEFNLRLLYPRTASRHPSHTPAPIPGHSSARFRLLSEL